MICKKNSKNIISAGFFILILVLLDQITKLIAAAALKWKSPFEIIPGVFELHYLENTSAAFGKDPVSLFNSIFHFSYFTEHPEALLSWKMGFFIVFTIVAVLVLSLIYLRIPMEKRFCWIDMILLLLISGAIGNFIDRVFRRYVIDFFYFKLIDFPIFNVADIYVTVGVALLIIFILFYYKEEDFDAIFPPKKNKESL